VSDRRPFCKHPPSPPRPSTSRVAVIPTNEAVSLLVSIVNDADVPFNLTGITGGLYSPVDFSQNLFNFTGLRIGEAVEPSKEFAVDFLFAAPPVAEEMSVRLVAELYYEQARGSNRRAHRHIALNETVTLAPAARSFDVRTYIPYLLALATSLAGLYIVKDLVFGAPAAGGASAGAARAAAEEESKDEGRLNVVAEQGKRRVGHKRAASGAAVTAAR